MSTSNPYAAPTAAVADVAPEIPADIAKKIKSAWIAACISGTVTLVMTLIAMRGTPILELDAWSLLDVGLIFALAFGIYKKSRVCAVVLLAYFILSHILVMMASGKASGLLVALIFGYYYVQGIVGTFAFHKWRAAHRGEAG